MLADEAAFTKLAQISNSAINEEQKEALDLFADHVDMTIFGFALIIVDDTAKDILNYTIKEEYGASMEKNQHNHISISILIP